MEPTDAKRRLSAILMSDLAGYSRLMGEDEQAALRALTAHREVFTKYVGQHDGRIVNAPGDSILAEFGSVVDAVACAVETLCLVQGDRLGRNGFCLCDSPAVSGEIG